MRYFMVYLAILAIFTISLFGVNPDIDNHLKLKILAGFCVIAIICYCMGLLLSYLFDENGYFDRRRERQRQKSSKHK